MSRLREGRANTARGAAHFLRETVGRVRHAGAKGTTHGAGRQRLLCPRHRRRLPQDECPLLHHHPPVCQSLRNLIEAIPEGTGRPSPTGWTAPPMWPRPPTLPLRVSPAPRRCGSSSRVRPTPGSQLALFASYSYHGLITDRDGDTLELEADHRSHADVENAIRDLKYGVGLNHSPRAASPPMLRGWRYRCGPQPGRTGRRASLWQSRR